MRGFFLGTVGMTTTLVVVISQIRTANSRRTGSMRGSRWKRSFNEGIFRFESHSVIKLDGVGEARGCLPKFQQTT